MLPKAHRFTKNDFSNIFNSADTKRIRSFFFTVLVADQSSGDMKVAVIVSKKKLKKASDRNYIKRVIRHFAYQNKEQLKSKSYVFIPNQNINQATKETLWQDLEKLLIKLI